MRLYILQEAITDRNKAKRAEFIKSQYEPRWQGLPGYDDIDSFLEQVAKIDPTTAGTMMPWIARLAIKNPNLNKTEDFMRLKKDLQNFEKFKPQLQNKDINSYKSYADVYTAIEPFTVKRKKTPGELKKARDAAKYAKFKQEVTTVYQGSEGWIRIPETKAAAQFIGQGTRWCTSARTSNMFDHYSNTDKLFIIFDKASGKRIQLHLRGGQVADESDTMIGFKAVPAWATSYIVNWYKSNNPNMDLTKLMRLSQMAGADVSDVATDDQSAFLKLMQQYGV